MLNDDVILTFRSDCILRTNVGDYVCGRSNQFNDDSRGITMPVVLAVYHFYYSHLQLFQDKGREKMQTGMRDSVNRLTTLKSIDCIILLRFFENRGQRKRVLNVPLW